MNNDIKLAKYYDPEKMRYAILMMEQYWALSQDKNLDEKNKKCAYALYQHFKRLAICVVAKELSSDFSAERIVDVDYMKNMYKGYTN